MSIKDLTVAELIAIRPNLMEAATTLKKAGYDGMAMPYLTGVTNIDRELLRRVTPEKQDEQNSN